MNVDSVSEPEARSTAWRTVCQSDHLTDIVHVGSARSSSATPTLGVLRGCLLVGLALMLAMLIAVAVVTLVRPRAIGSGSTGLAFIVIPAVSLWHEFLRVVAAVSVAIGLG